VHLVANPGQTLAVTGTVALSGSLFTVERGATFTLCGDGSGDITLQNRNGSAVRVEGEGTFIMKGGVISNSKGTEIDGVYIGGGVYVEENAEFTMSGGSISGNTAGSGGGVYVSGTVNMTGGSISGNTANTYGSGVYMNGTFTMSGGAVVAQEVYLANGKTIGVSGSLTPPTGEYSARITMADSNNGTQVLAGMNGHQLDNNDISKFKLNAASMTIMISGNTGVIASADMSATVNGQLVYYASLADAIAAATGTEESPTVISLMNDIEATASIAVDSGKHITIVPSSGEVTINRSGSNTGSLFTVESNASLTLKGNGNAQLVLDGGSEDELNAEAPLVTVNSSGTLTMNDGAVLKNNKITVSYSGSGVRMNGGTFTMTGGEISGNKTTTNGGGIYLASGSKFNMSGGTISDTMASGTDGGGGVYVASGGTFTMSAGSISDNTAAANGGGVHIGNSSSFTMENGTISGNFSNGNGGGVYASGTFTMNGGTISGNTTTGNGGGVCLYSGTFTKTDGIVYGANAGDNANKVGVGTGAALYKGTSATSTHSTSDETIY
jgi:hypothetical protein